MVRQLLADQTDGPVTNLRTKSMCSGFRHDSKFSQSGASCNPGAVQFSNKKGIIVDIRFNGGGNIDQEIIDILERQPYQFWNQRTGARSWGRRPRQAIAGPKVMMINARSGSDSEVTPMAFRQLGLGRIVGNPTAAAVIATGSYNLINGGTIRTPGSLVITYDPTKPNNYGVTLENLGVPPDVWVKNSPMDEVKKFDRELKTAIEEALRMLKDSAPKKITGNN
jgi:tricorn protease